MEMLILTIILFLAIRQAVQEGSLHWQSSKAANRKATKGQKVSRRAASAVQHDVGYWFHQVLSGFPATRHGLVSGWRDGRAAQDEGYAARQKARADHLSLRARLIPEVREHRRRSAEAIEQIRAARQPEPEPAPDTPPDAPQPQQQAPPYTRQYCPGCGLPVGEPGYCPVCRMPGGPGHQAQQAQQAQQPVTSPAPGPGTAPPPPPTKGSTAMAGDTTYTEQLAELQALRRDAEEADAAVARKRMTSRLDILQSMGLDAATLADAAEIDDALADLEKAAKRLLEAADTAITGLQRRHGGIKSAVDDSPVDKPADGGFYQD